jgi:tetratricopeptide (TPR) repeat protein
MGQSPRQLIGHHPQWRISWLAGLLAVAACGTPIETRSIPHPDLAGIDGEAQAQIGEAKTRLEETETAGTDEADLALQSGELGRLYQAYDFDDAALAAYWNAAAIAPDDFRWLYHLGALELQAGDLDAGTEHLERALTLRPNDPPTLLRLGKAALDGGDYERAAALYGQAGGVEPECAAAHFGLGLAAVGQRDYQQAVDALEWSLRAEPAANQAYRPLALAYRELGETEKAREQLALAGTVMPSCPDPLMAEVRSLSRGASALFERAALAEVEGRTALALDLARQAVAADPDHAAAHRLLGSLLTKTGELREARRQLERAAELEPSDRRTYVLLGRAHRASGDLSSSAAALEKAVELDPQYSRAQIELALTEIERGRWGQARQGLERALELDPDNLELRVQLARAMAATGDPAAARTELEGVLEADDELALAHLALGVRLLAEKEPVEAEEHLTRALETEGVPETYSMAHYQLARLAAGRQDETLAITHLESALELTPAFLEAQMALGEVQMAAGNHRDAARTWAAAAERWPKAPQPRVGEALALLYSGRDLDARRGLESANREFPRDPEIAHLLARVLATATAPRVRDGARALQLSTGLFSNQPSLAHGETVAMALAEQGRWDEAVEWQTRLLEQARTDGADPEVLEQIEARLADYQLGRPVRSAW